MAGGRINSLALWGGVSVLGLFALSVRQEDRAHARLGAWARNHSFEQGQLVPGKALTGVGCCIDEIEDSLWKNGSLILKSGNHTIDLKLGDPKGENFALPKKLQFDVLSAVWLQGHVYVGETKHNRLLDVLSSGTVKTLFGSAELGGVYSVRVETKAPSVNFIMTTGPRDRSGEFLLEAVPKQANGDKLYLRHAGVSGPALIESEGEELHKLEAGEELTAPSGLALSPDQTALFVADEREDELVWLHLTRVSETPSDEQPNYGWKSNGRFARFPLHEGDRGLFRGLEIVADPKYPDKWYLAGAGPRGIYFYDRNGRGLGEIDTGLPVSYLRMSSEVLNGEPKMYVVAGKSVWQLEFKREQSR
jgi:hypothetical protein